MLYTKVQPQILKCFTIYEHGGYHLTDRNNLNRVSIVLRQKTLNEVRRKLAQEFQSRSCTKVWTDGRRIDGRTR